MTDIQAEWKFRGLILSLPQKQDANGRAKLKRQLATMLRSGYSLTRDDHLALADYFEPGKAGRPLKMARRPTRAQQIVNEVRTIQSAEGCTLKRAIAIYGIKRSFVIGAETAATEWAKHEDQVRQELNRARKASKKPK